MFWKRKPRVAKSGDGLPLTDYEQGLNALDRPDAWPTLEPAALHLVAFTRFAELGASRDAIACQSATEVLYSVLVQRLTASDRLKLQRLVCQYAKEKRTGVQALLPFLLYESDPRIVSNATIDYAMLMPRVESDPLSGPKWLIAHYEGQAHNDSVRLGVLTGLILLGDERLLPLLRGRWKDFRAPEDRRKLASAWSGFVATLLVEFLLDWLENTRDDSDVGAIAGAMARMPLDAKTGAVMRQHTCFPVFSAKPGKEIEILEMWSFGEYARRIQPRLAPLIAREPPPKVIPEILRAWTSSN